MKLMVIVAYNVSGVIVCHFVPHGRTVIADYYRSFLQRQLRHVMREKCPGLKNPLFSMTTQCHMVSVINNWCSFGLIVLYVLIAR